jgi:hypothetical protein
MDGVSGHDWLAPRLASLVAEAASQGIARDVCVAVINDLINGPDYNAAVVVDDENWNQDIGEPDYMVNQDATQSDGIAGATDAGELNTRLQNFSLRRGRSGGGRTHSR